MAAVFAYPFARITMSNYRYLIQAAEKQLLINIDRQVARQLGHVGYLHVPRWERSTCTDHGGVGGSREVHESGQRQAKGR